MYRVWHVDKYKITFKLVINWTNEILVIYICYTDIIWAFWVRAFRHIQEYYSPQIFPLQNIYSWKMLRKLKWQIPGEPLATRYNWCQGPVPGRGLAVEKHCSRSHYVQSSLWRRLWTCRKTDYWMNECIRLLPVMDFMFFQAVSPHNNAGSNRTNIRIILLHIFTLPPCCYY